MASDQRFARLACGGSVGLIAYTFVGYPAIAALLARLAPRPVRADRALCPRVSVIIAAHNEQDVIEAKLENTFALEYPREQLEVIVVTDGSDDDTPRLAAAGNRAIVLHSPGRRGKLAAMGRGAAAASGEVIVFSDANNEYSRTSLLELTAPFADETVGVVTGRKVIDDGSGRPLDRAEGLYWRYESKLKEWESRTGSVVAAAGEILAFRRTALPEIAADLLVEDLAQVLAAAAAGWRVVYAPAALSVERASATLADEETRRARIVAGRWQVMWRVLPRLALQRPRVAWQLVSHKGTRPLIPGALAMLAVSSLSLSRRSRPAAGLVVGQAAFYGLALVGRRAERRGGRNRLGYLPYYFCRMNAAALRGPLSLLARRQSVAWERVRRAPVAGRSAPPGG